MQMNNSKLISLWSIVQCLIDAEKEIGKDRLWNSINSKQNRFLKLFKETRNVSCPFSSNELTTYFGLYSEEGINKFLKENNFDIQLKKFQPTTNLQYSFGVASILKIILKWKKQLKNSSVFNEKTVIEYNALYTDSVKFFKNNLKEIIVCISTETNDKVYIQKFDKYIDIFNLHDKIKETKLSRKIIEDYGGCTFPEINYSSNIDILWIEEMWCKCQVFSEDDIAIIIQALQQNKFKMDCIGVEIDSATAMEIQVISGSYSSTKPIFVINESFILWVERDNIDFPIFVGYFEEDSWIKSKKS